jgi:hypothetical protein
VCAAVFLIHPLAAAAGTISISVEVRPTLRPGTLAVALTVSNSGDEAAASVLPTVQFGGKEVRGTRQESLAPGSRIDTVIDVPFVATPGQWPLVTTVDYADPNGYPFQALQVALIAAGEATPSLVVLTELDTSPVRESAAIQARVKSLSDAAHQAQVRFITPRGLEVAPPTHALPLAPWADAVAEARAINRGALPGSRYPVFATIEYDDAGVHHAALSRGLIEIQAPVITRGWIPLAAALALVAVWVIVVVVRRRRLRQAS